MEERQIKQIKKDIKLYIAWRQEEKQKARWHKREAENYNELIKSLEAKLPKKEYNGII